MGAAIAFVRWHRRPFIEPLLEYEDINFNDMLPAPVPRPAQGFLERDAVQGHAAGWTRVAVVVAPALDDDEISL